LKAYYKKKSRNWIRHGTVGHRSTTWRYEERIRALDAVIVAAREAAALL
jgi:hypothetical protein